MPIPGRPAESKPKPKRKANKQGKGFSETLADNLVNAFHSDQAVAHVRGEQGENGLTVVRTDGPFRGLVQALRWRFYLAPGFSEAEIDHWNQIACLALRPQYTLSFPTTPNIRFATVVLLPARPGQSAFTMEHEAILRKIHGVPVKKVHGFKPFARKMEWVEACLAQNEWLRDRKWDIRLPDMPDSDLEEDAKIEKEEQEKAKALAMEAAKRKMQEMKSAK